MALFPLLIEARSATVTSLAKRSSLTNTKTTIGASECDGFEAVKNHDDCVAKNQHEERRERVKKILIQPSCQKPKRHPSEIHQEGDFSKSPKM
jgi:hypothetical protein